MGRKFIFAFVFTLLCGFAFAKENLAILPFTGGQGNEGETIAELFSFEPRLGEVFSLIPRTSVSRAVARERGFQMASGMTDPDTVVSIANEVGARYVVAGSITSVGNNNLLVISILDIRNLQQIAGDFQTYPRGRIEDLRRRLPSMAENIIRATLRNTASLPKLAIVPVQLQGDMDWRVADTLAQLLAIHLIRSGKYAVFPRTGSLEQVQAEHDAQMRGYTADRNIVGIGHGENPDYVLSVVARKLGSVNMFNAVIINLLTRVQDVGRSVDYQDINDGMRAMEELSIALTSTTEQISRRQQEEEERKREEEKQRLKDKRKAEFVDDLRENSGLGLGVRGGVSINFFENLPKSWDGDGVAPMFSALLEIKIGRFFSIQPEFVFVLATEESTLRYSTSGNFTYRSYFQDFYLGIGSGIWRNDTRIHYSLVQIPVLAKANLSTGNFTFSPAVGLGFNIPVGIGGLSDIYSTYNAHSMNSAFDDIETTDFDVEVSMPISLIFGMEVGLKFGKNHNWLLFADLRYIKDLGDTKIEADISKFNAIYESRPSYVRDLPLEEFNIDPKSFSLSRSSFDISLGIKFIIPFTRQ